MAFTSVKERLLTTTASKGETRTATRLFVVKSDTNIRPTSAINAPGIPNKGDAHPEDNNLRALDITADYNGDSRKSFLVLVSYGTSSIDPRVDGETDPTKEPAIFTFSSGVLNEILEEDIFGLTITNNVGDPFVPPIQQEVIVPIISISVNTKNFSLTDWLTFTNSINKTPINLRFGEFGKEQLRLAKWNVAEAFQEEIKYFKHTFEFEHRSDKLGIGPDPVSGWDRVILNRGFNKLSDGEQLGFLKDDKKGFAEPGEKIAITDKSGRPVTTPQLLNADGGLVLKGEKPLYLVFETKQRQEFNTLARKYRFSIK